MKLAKSGKRRRQITVNGNGCWIVSGYGYENGYKKLHYKGKDYRAHRIMYTLFTGKNINGIDLDHLCRNRACANPNHLEPVDNRTNILRGIGPTAINARKTLCNRGHQFEKHYRRNGWRFCRYCKRVSDAKCQARKRLKKKSALKDEMEKKE